MKHTLDSIHARLQDNIVLNDIPLYLVLGQFNICIRSNSSELLEKLQHYFSYIVAASIETPGIEILVYERETVDLGLEYIDWEREPGKQGRKDAYFDITGGRIICKVRTGMLFVQSNQYRIAAGSCNKYDNQVINFINTQYIIFLQQQGAMICHASAIHKGNRCLAMAGLSGGGKSTLMLKLLDDKKVNYITNDRLLLMPEGEFPRATGIPKLPRINPGTIVFNPALQKMIPAQRRKQLMQLPRKELWEIEEKYDVYINEVYGAGRITLNALLNTFLVLNWQHDSDSELAVEQVDISQRPDLLGAIMKDSGPFYQYADGSFYQQKTPFDTSAYLEVLEGVKVYEARGRVDFEGLKQFCEQELLN
jgi:HprK-related kinase B